MLVTSSKASILYYKRIKLRIILIELCKNKKESYMHYVTLFLNPLFSSESLLFARLLTKSNPINCEIFSRRTIKKYFYLYLHENIFDQILKCTDWKKNMTKEGRIWNWELNLKLSLASFLWNSFESFTWFIWCWTVKKSNFADI